MFSLFFPDPAAVFSGSSFALQVDNTYMDICARYIVLVPFQEFNEDFILCSDIGKENIDRVMNNARWLINEISNRIVKFINEISNRIVK
jgi:hypothetical protein